MPPSHDQVLWWKLFKTHYMDSLITSYASYSMIHFQHTFPPQFGVMTKGGYEVMVYGIQCNLS